MFFDPIEMWTKMACAEYETSGAPYRSPAIDKSRAAKLAWWYFITQGSR